MTIERWAELLIEGPRRLGEADAAKASHADQLKDGDAPKIDKKLAVFLNRLLLRIFSVPSLQMSLRDAVLVQDEDAKDGRCKVQLDFMRLPEEVYPQVVRLLAAPREPRLLRYAKGGSSRLGIELDIEPEDFTGEELDYSL